MRRESLLAGVVLLATVLFAFAPLVFGELEIPTARHHLLHAAMLGGAALAGILFAEASAGRPGNAGWLLVAMVTPVLAMLLMWPSQYAYVEAHRYAHTLQHLGLIVLGFVTGYGGQRYAAGVGWATGIGIVAMALFSVWGYGVGPAAAPR